MQLFTIRYIMKYSLTRLFSSVAVSLMILSCESNMSEDVEAAYAELPEVIDFNFHVRPILSDRCFQCHGPDANARKADLRLDIEQSALSTIPQKDIFLIVPGQPQESAVIDRILSNNLDYIMPPPESKLELTAEEKATLIKWVKQGAQWKKHWAFIVPEKIELPDITSATKARNEIDYFVLNKLEKLGLEPSKEANKETLIRRLSFDLTGLPPTLDEIKDFKNDQSDKAYEKVVDRIFASPKYGERWTWEWLDVARYADTNGFQADPTRTMWPWRDWVINAFNKNMPYDEFTVKQIAGDLLPNAKREDVLATGFNRNNTYNGEGGRIPEETRVENVFDRVETVGTTWLGLTLNCSRCHDHKFDAISQKEYYQLYDYFNQTSEPGNVYGSGRVRPVVDMSPLEQLQQAEELKAFIDKVGSKVENFETVKFPGELDLPLPTSEKVEKIRETAIGALKKEPTERNNYQLSQIINYFEKADPKYAALLKELKSAKVNHAEQLKKNLMVMVMDELASPRQSYILARGTYDKHLEPVYRNVPAALPPLPEGVENNRLALAKWVVSTENPLTARVTINRYWQAFFGKGLVKTIEDFGVQGALPTHPELLDWLAVDFQENGWDLKRLFKQIVMSSTYRQSSKVTEEMLEVDSENKYLSRATRMRLPSWMLRDQALFVSGLLTDTIGGEPVKPYQPSGIWSEATFGKIKYNQDHGDDLYRRTIYTFWRRIVGPTTLFDNSPRQVCTVKAMNTNTPLHALTTLNDITYMEASRVLAERILTTKSSDKERIAYAFELTTSRTPTSEEILILETRINQLKKDFTETINEARKIIKIGEYELNEALDPVEHASYTVLSSLLLNLDETITRQ
ncbi:MAG: hypothetical protein ACJA2S_004631 [Cyclobacteriaceae bacterium]